MRVDRGRQALARLRGRRIAGLGDAAELGEPSLLPLAAVVTAAVLYATLPAKFIHGTGSVGWLDAVRWLVPACSIPLMAALAVTAPRRHFVHTVRRRTVATAVVALITAANSTSIVLLVHLVTTGQASNGSELIRAAIHIWCSNVIVFALWFWQLDGGGPMERRRGLERPDFLFAQQATPELADAAWRPQFLDYVYLSFTNSTAFSPTDTMPLTPMAKMLMLLESAASLLLLVMVAARAVNILH